MLQNALHMCCVCKYICAVYVSTYVCSQYMYLYVYSNAHYTLCQELVVP